MCLIYIVLVIFAELLYIYILYSSAGEGSRPVPTKRSEERRHPVPAVRTPLPGRALPRFENPSYLHHSSQASEDLSNSTFTINAPASTYSEKWPRPQNVYRVHQGRKQAFPEEFCRSAEFEHASSLKTRTDRFARLTHARTLVRHDLFRDSQSFSTALFSTLSPKQKRVTQQNVRKCHSQQDASKGFSASRHGPNQDETSDQLTHTDAHGRASMVNVGNKAVTRRTATASARVLLGSKAFGLVRANQIAKGDALVVAQLAGIMGAKQTSGLIPLCHPVSLDHTSVTVELLEEGNVAVVWATCHATGRTGVEMEALTAASVAALALYDMCKAVSRDIVITDIRLLSKTGGQRGDFQRTS